MGGVNQPPNPRVQRTRSSPSARHSPLTRHPLIDTPSNYSFHWVRQRSSGTIDFFRFTQELRKPPQIYPGDTVEVFSLRYSTQHVAEGERLAKVAVYLKGYAPITQVLDVSPASFTVRA